MNIEHTHQTNTYTQPTSINRHIYTEWKWQIKFYICTCIPINEIHKNIEKYEIKKLIYKTDADTRMEKIYKNNK